MFDHDSRYRPIPDAVWTAPDGTPFTYKRRRFLPQGGKLPMVGQTVPQEGERLDLFTARTLGNPEHFWRIADANDAMDPSTLTALPGRRLRIPEPRVEPPVRQLENA